MTHLIIIPAFDEERTIGWVVAAARRHGPVTVVDDGSTDATSARARAAGAAVVAHRHRRGKGAAIQTGAVLARQMGATWMVTLDGDGQHDPEAIPRLLATARQAPGAIVIAGRFASVVGMPRARLVACRTAGFFINRLTGTAIRDTQSGFRCYPVRLFDQIALRSGGFVLETEVLVASVDASWDLVEVEATAAHRTVRPSRFHPLSDGVAIGAYLAACILIRWTRRMRSRLAISSRVGGARDSSRRPWFEPSRLSKSEGARGEARARSNPGQPESPEELEAHPGAAAVRGAGEAIPDPEARSARAEPRIPRAREAEGRP